MLQSRSRGINIISTIQKEGKKYFIVRTNQSRRDITIESVLVLHRYTQMPQDMFFATKKNNKK